MESQNNGMDCEHSGKKYLDIYAMIEDYETQLGIAEALISREKNKERDNLIRGIFPALSELSERVTEIDDDSLEADIDELNERFWEIEMIVDELSRNKTSDISNIYS